MWGGKGVSAGPPLIFPVATKLPGFGLPSWASVECPRAFGNVGEHLSLSL